MSSKSLRTAGRSATGAAGVVVMTVVFLAGCSSSASTPSAAGGQSAATSGAASGASAGGAATTAATTAAAVPGASATGTFNSCSVVTQADASAAIGESVTAGVLGTATVEGGLACVFYGSAAPSPRDPNVAQPDSVRVVVVEGGSATTWYNDYKSSPQVHAQSVSGYGDQAYYDGYASLSVLKGEVYVRISISPAGAAPSLTDEEKLMSAVLPNL